MLNQSGVTRKSYGNINQNLGNVEMQVSVGCVVAQSLGVAVDGKKNVVDLKQVGIIICCLTPD